jgi:2-C-methyl-D-erythritol 4-phosphate cytidylyltransferase
MDPPSESAEGGRRHGEAGTTWCVLVAAGAGTRLGAGRPKAFAPLAGRPLLAESLERLDLSDWIDAIVVVAPPEWEEPTILLAEELVVSKVAAVVTGGETRADSVVAGLAEVPEEALVVLVHDAARPLVTDAVIERVIKGLADGSVGAVPTIPVSDTIKSVDRGRVVETVDRTSLVAVQTPQAFVAERLRAAYAISPGGATDCASVVEATGASVAVVAGDPRLLKVTDTDDLARIEAWLVDV